TAPPTAFLWRCACAWCALSACRTDTGSAAAASTSRSGTRNSTPFFSPRCPAAAASRILYGTRFAYNAQRAGERDRHISRAFGPGTDIADMNRFLSPVIGAVRTSRGAPRENGEYVRSVVDYFLLSHKDVTAGMVALDAHEPGTPHGSESTAMTSRSL